MAKAVLASKTELKCKLCSHELRAEIDALLLLRSQRGKVDGVAVNEAYVIAALGGMGVVNPTAENLKVHWRKHCEVVDSSVVEAQVENRKAIVARAEDGPVDVDAVLDKIIKLGESDLDTRVEITGTSGVTVDQMLKAASVKSQRRTDEATRQLLGATGAAISAAFAGAALPPARPAIEVEAIEEGEIVGGD